MTQSITESERMVWNHRVIRRSNSPSIDPEWTYREKGGKGVGPEQAFEIVKKELKNCR